MLEQKPRYYIISKGDNMPVQTARSSYELTTSTQIRTVSGALTACQVITDGSNQATVIGYDVAAAADIAAGNKIFELVVAGSSRYGGFTKTFPVRFGTGLYVTVSGTGASYIIEWLK